MNAQEPLLITSREYDLLDAIAHDSLVTQASLSAHLGMAVGSVNWYIKRLINLGYIKVSHLDRTRLKYLLTPEGMGVITQRTMQYLKRSLAVYTDLRQKARTVVSELKSKRIRQVALEGNDEVIDILRLTCIEEGLELVGDRSEVLIKAAGQGYKVVFMQVLAEDLKEE